MEIERLEVQTGRAQTRRTMDGEQVSPLPIGELALDVEHLIDAFLRDIPLEKLFDGKLSLYDIAKQSFSTGALRLLEHFRCVPDIIRFSNALSYEGAITPLREVLPKDPAPAVVAHRVASRGTAGKVNEDEAIAVASLVISAIEQPEYHGKSFGIISMAGDEQAYRIEALVRTIVRPVTIEERALLSGSAAQFQGDERDVMFLSMVDTEGVPLRLDRQTKTFQQRFNVAARRARDQMWVVYSLDPETELKSDDIHRRLIAHALDPTAPSKLEAAGIQRADSPFERDVIQRLTRAGYRVKTQHAVGAYRIDIVVEGLRDRLAVECDGDRYQSRGRFAGAPARTRDVVDSSGRTTKTKMFSAAAERFRPNRNSLLGTRARLEHFRPNRNSLLGTRALQSEREKKCWLSRRQHRPGSPD